MRSKSLEVPWGEKCRHRRGLVLEKGLGHGLLLSACCVHPQPWHRSTVPSDEEPSLSHCLSLSQQKVSELTNLLAHEWLDQATRLCLRSDANSPFKLLLCCPTPNNPELTGQLKCLHAWQEPGMCVASCMAAVCVVKVVQITMFVGEHPETPGLISRFKLQLTTRD